MVDLRLILGRPADAAHEGMPQPLATVLLDLFAAIAVAVLAGIPQRAGIIRVGVRPGGHLIEVLTEDPALLDPGRNAVTVDVMTGAALERSVRTIMVQCRGLCIAGGVDGRRHRVQAVDRLVTTLASHTLVTSRVAHQARLGRVVERREGVDVAALLHVGCCMAVRTVGLTR